MTRIVAGTVGGRSLQVPPKGTRPTSDRVREAIFSRLEHYGVLEGAYVLDLYAGSGALGLEAASRGAQKVVLVDAARAAAEVCRANVKTLGLTNVQVVQDKAEKFVLSPPATTWDVVFIDPPYDLAEAVVAELLRQLSVTSALVEDAVVVVERSTRSPEPQWPAGWEVLARKDYGETAVYYAGPAAAEAGEAAGDAS
jgi:16S rRNA (guanine966-N2)-methyltransferase